MEFFKYARQYRGTVPLTLCSVTMWLRYWWWYRNNEVVVVYSLIKNCVYSDVDPVGYLQYTRYTYTDCPQGISCDQKENCICIVAQLFMYIQYCTLYTVQYIQRAHRANMHSRVE